MAIGKVGRNGTLNENGTFYSVQDVNVLLENSGDDLPKPTIADAGKAVVVDDEGKYALGEGSGGGSAGLVVTIGSDAANASYKQITETVNSGGNVYFIDSTSAQGGNTVYYLGSYGAVESENSTQYLVIIYSFYRAQTLTKNLVATNENANMTIRSIN